MGIVNHLVDLHVKRGSDIYQKGSMGRTPLLLACLRGHLACVRLLGWSGFAIADRLGKMPFHAACQSGCPDLATYIYEQGVDIDSPAITSFMVQMQPSSEGTHLSMARMRLSPLWCATICMHAPVVRLLLRWRANQKVTAQCALCAGDQCSCGQAFMTGLTPPEFASRHMDDSEEIVGGLNSACSTKRKRRGTPI